MSELLFFPRRQAVSHHLHSRLKLPPALGGLLIWKEFEVSWLGTQPLQMAQSSPFPRNAFVALAYEISGNHSCPSGCSTSAPNPASAVKPGQQRETFSLPCFGKEQGTSSPPDVVPPNATPAHTFVGCTGFHLGLHLCGGSFVLQPAPSSIRSQTAVFSIPT